MFNYCSTNLLEIKSLLNNIDNKKYSTPLVLLSGASVGQHVRHILEFYTCLITAKNLGVVNYDGRQRNLQLETDVVFAQNQIDEIVFSLPTLEATKPLFLAGNYTHSINPNTTISTTFGRELAYCLEHSIHHQALIKIGLKELNLETIINENFGVAPATIRYKQEQCAQ
ncbi:MAG: DinB family protein [Flavobacteriales bacterium]